MTTLIAWASVDETGISALNIASDSRFSWTVEELAVVNGKPEMRKNIISTWDSGKKLFCCRNTTDFFGYSGNIITQSTILSQIVDAIDFGVLNLEGLNPAKRHGVIEGLFHTAYKNLEVSQQTKMAFLHGYRENNNKDATFHLWETNCADEGSKWSDCEKHMDPKQSSIVAACGSGLANPGNKLSKIKKQFGSNVSSIYQAINEALNSGSDPFSGGLCQLMKIDRINTCPQPVGLAHNDSRYCLGLNLGDSGAAGSIDWRNKDYTYLDGDTLEPKSNAKNQLYRLKDFE